MVDGQEMAWRGRIRLVDEVAEVLRARIYAGAYLPGSPLRQEQLAAELQISRTPLREALRVLEREGLLTSEPGRGVRVVSATPDALLDAYAVREVIDGVAARLAAERATPDDVARLRALLRRQGAALATADRAFDAGDYTLANVDFHAAIVDTAANEFLVGQLPLLPLTAQLFAPKQVLDEERALQAVDEHERIVLAIERGDGPLAEREARRHIRITIDMLAVTEGVGTSRPEPASELHGT